MANGIIGKVTAGGGTHLVTSTFYGTCATAAGTAAKIVKLADATADAATAIVGMTLAVKFTNSNTAANPTLTVQRNGNTTNLIAATSIKAYGTTAPGTTVATSWRAGAVVLFVYVADGSNYYWTQVSSLDDNTTYSSQAAASGGTTLSLVTTGEKYTWNNKSTLAIGTTSTTAAAGNHTHNYAGSSSAGGAANSLANFKVTTSASLWAVDSPTTNAIGYQGGLTKAAWNYQQTDGAIYDQFYNSSWIHQIFGDYRTGQISVRGKNNGTWQAWRRVLDETNASTILGLGTLATKSTISAHSYTPAGTITLTNGNTTTTVSAASSGATTYTPGGTVSQPTFTGSSLTSTGNFTPAGSVSVSTNATTNKTATVSVASSGDTTYTPGGTNSAPAFTGTAATIVVNGGTGTATYTPAGTIAVNGTTSTATVIKTATFNTVVTSATVANEILTISTGASGSSTNQTGVRIADPAYKFTGTGTRLTASYTPAGSVAAPTFTGTAVRLVTGNIAVPNTYTATFTGTQGSVSVSGTPAGTVSKPTFSGTAVRLVTGNISRPTSATFSGTPATLTHTVS